MLELKAKARNTLGKKVKSIRKEGFLPAVLYGENVKNQPIAIPRKDFEKAYRQAGESTLVKLEIDGKPFNVLIHDISYDPLRGTPIHADFYAVRMDKTIRTKVSIEFFGESPAVKNEGGILVKVMQEIEVEALPQDLPREVRADLSTLSSFEARILVRDIALPKGVKPHAHAEEVVALVEAPRTEEEIAALTQTPSEAAPAEVKTEQEIKRAAKAEAEATEEPAGKAESK